MLQSNININEANSSVRFLLKYINPILFNLSYFQPKPSPNDHESSVTSLDMKTESEKDSEEKVFN